MATCRYNRNYYSYLYIREDLRRPAFPTFVMHLRTPYSRSLSGFRRLGLSALLLGPALSALAQAPPPAVPVAGTVVGDAVRAGRVKVVRGRVMVFDGSAERPLAAGDPVMASDRIGTAADSSASLVLRDGTVIVLGPSSRLEMRGFGFDPTTYEGNLVVGVLRGTMRMVSGLIRKNHPDAVRIETPTALIGIRGTDFIVDVDPAGEPR